MYIRVKKLSEGAKLPQYQTAGASGMDLYACLPAGHERLTIGAGARLLIPCGVAVEIPTGYEGQIRPRSGLAHKFGLLAAFGTIDSDYRGEISVNLFNHSFVNYKVENGERIAQLVICPVVRCRIDEVLELSETKRGSDGFGSSGKM